MPEHWLVQAIGTFFLCLIGYRICCTMLGFVPGIAIEVEITHRVEAAVSVATTQEEPDE